MNKYVSVLKCNKSTGAAKVKTVFKMLGVEERGAGGCGGGGCRRHREDEGGMRGEEGGRKG